MADAELSEVVQQSEYLQQPDNDCNHYNSIENSLDLTLHGNEAVYKPKQDADDAERDYNSDEGHLVFSNRGTRHGAFFEP
jgi:hypothetical protein